MSCTDNVCDGDGGCDYPPGDGYCHIAGACVTVGTPKADDPCRVCVAGEAWSANDGGSCEDDDEVCTVDDRCVGTTCMSGPRPSDAATDWAEKPLVTSPPTFAAVMAVAHAGLSDPLALTYTLVASEMMTPTGPRELAASSLALARRTPSGWLPYLIYDGFVEVELASFAREPSTGELVLAVNKTGDGSRTTSAGTVSDGEGDTIVFARADDPSIEAEDFRPWVLGQIDALTINTKRTVHVVGRAEGVVTVPELPDVSVGVGGEQTAYAVALASGQFVSRLFGVSANGMDRAYACGTAADGLVMSTWFRGSARLFGATETPFTTAAAQSSLLVWFSVGGEISGIVEPFALGEADRPKPYNHTMVTSCDSESVVLKTLGELGATDALPIALSSSAEHAVVARIMRDGSLAWSLRFASLDVTATSVLADGGWLIAGQRVGASGGEVIDAVTTHAIGLDVGAFVIWVAPNGNIRHIHRLTDGAQAVTTLTSVIELPDASIAVGGAFPGLDTTFFGADGQSRLTSTADANPFLVGINTNDGLVCSAP